jgi:hypothetical protein
MENIKIDKSVFSVVSSHDECDEDDKKFWHSKTPLERLEALEIMREINYGKHETFKRLSRIFEIV